jgi:hypothetical protein
LLISGQEQIQGVIAVFQGKSYTPLTLQAQKKQINTIYQKKIITLLFRTDK